MDIQRQIGRNVRRLRLPLKISQINLALEAGVSRGHMSDIERGVANPSVRIVSDIAKVLNVQPWVLLAPATEQGPAPKNLPRGRNVHHQGRRVKKKTR